MKYGSLKRHSQNHINTFLHALITGEKCETFHLTGQPQIAIDWNKWLMRISNIYQLSVKLLQSEEAN